MTHRSVSCRVTGGGARRVKSRLGKKRSEQPGECWGALMDDKFAMPEDEIRTLSPEQYRWGADNG